MKIQLRSHHNQLDLNFCLDLLFYKDPVLGSGHFSTQIIHLKLQLNYFYLIT